MRITLAGSLCFVLLAAALSGCQSDSGWASSDLAFWQKSPSPAPPAPGFPTKPSIAYGTPAPGAGYTSPGGTTAPPYSASTASFNAPSGYSIPSQPYGSPSSASSLGYGVNTSGSPYATPQRGPYGISSLPSTPSTGSGTPAYPDTRAAPYGPLGSAARTAAAPYGSSGGSTATTAGAFGSTTTNASPYGSLSNPSRTTAAPYGPLGGTSNASTAPYGSGSSLGDRNYGTSAAQGPSMNSMRTQPKYGGAPAEMGSTGYGNIPGGSSASTGGHDGSQGTGYGSPATGRSPYGSGTSSWNRSSLNSGAAAPYSSEGGLPYGINSSPSNTNYRSGTPANSTPTTSPDLIPYKQPVTPYGSSTPSYGPSSTPSYSPSYTPPTGNPNTPYTPGSVQPPDSHSPSRLGAVPGGYSGTAAGGNSGVQNAGYVQPLGGGYNSYK